MWRARGPSSLPFEPLVKANGWSLTTLLPYAKHRKLYNERMYACKYAPIPFTLFDLPSELRNQIYREVLHVDYIELAPLAFTEAKGLARIHHMRKYKKAIVPRLRLLRTNKRVNREATPIFYGGNEFRFSSDIGFDVLNFFCRTIGPVNTAMLRSVTECFPRDASEGDGAKRMSKTGWYNFEMVMHDKMGMRGFKYRPKRLTDARIVAGDDSQLLHYRVVISEETALSHFDLAKSVSLMQWMRADKLVSLRKQLVVLSIPEDDRRADCRASGEEIERMIEQFRSRDWDVACAVHDEYGNYELPEAAAISEDVSEDGEERESDAAS
ncbi:hypothetical protein LTR53_009707 [Teratosphaeriaceae sp. CCFEE 6253]|nr:hypothetical protein LTR53_009707 [Teratosphaeriaceae sp. CCFEE 6253]